MPFLKKYFLYFTFKISFIPDMVWRFGQQIFPYESVALFEELSHKGSILCSSIRGAWTFRRPLLAGRTVHLSASYQAVNFTPYLQFEI
jgi:hypothetical protein